MMILLLVRHASNGWVGRRLAGWTPGINLNEEGQAQAAALAERLATLPLAAVYSSPLERTLETATPIADAHGLSVQVREALGETSYGAWTGRDIKELRKEELWQVVQIYPGGVRFPGGESLREVQARVVAQLDTIRDAHPAQIVAAVSHADPIKLAAAHYLGLSLDLFQRLSVSVASVTAFAFDRLGPRLLCLNHTQDLPSLELDGDRENGRA